MDNIVLTRFEFVSILIAMVICAFLVSMVLRSKSRERAALADRIVISEINIKISKTAKEAQKHIEMHEALIALYKERYLDYQYSFSDNSKEDSENCSPKTSTPL